MSTAFFHYTEAEFQALQRKDPLLGRVMRHIGRIERRLWGDPLEVLVKIIIGQQISNIAQASVFKKLQQNLTVFAAADLLELGVTGLKQCGISAPKQQCILRLASGIAEGTLDLTQLSACSDTDIIRILTRFKGIGVWSVEMWLLFALGRKNILSYGDAALRKSVQRLYGYPVLNKTLWQQHSVRYSPYGSLASFYLWEVLNTRLAL